MNLSGGRDSSHRRKQGAWGRDAWSRARLRSGRTLGDPTWLDWILAVGREPGNVASRGPLYPEDSGTRRILGNLFQRDQKYVCSR